MQAGDIVSSVIGAFAEELGRHGAALIPFARAEGTKFATSLVEIARLRADGVISDEEAVLQLEIQKHATRAVVAALEGMTLLAAEAAINAALAVVRDVINRFAGFELVPA